MSFFSPKWWHGKSPVPYRGWIVRVSPAGVLTPFACGLRSPCGLGQDAAGELFVTDNQGDWMPACPIFHVREGDFFGHPASLDWTPEYVASQAKASDTIPPERASADRRPAAIWLPYKWSRSTGNLAADTTGGKFGPFAEQLFVAELTNGMVLRAGMERVRGEYQGWVLPFRRRIGSAVRVLFAPDGTLFTGFTNRGWGGFPPAAGVGRLSWTGRTPMEVQSVHLLQDGFEIAFTLPLAPEVQVDQATARVTQYDYDYWWEYGCPERATADVPVQAALLSDDRRTLVLRAPGLAPAKVARVVLSGIVGAGGEPLLHDELSYTVNELPEGPAAGAHVAKVVPPPPARESGEEGWLRLTYGNATDLWAFEGWELCEAELDPDAPRQLLTKPGDTSLTNTAAEHPSAYVGELQLGDGDYHVEFMLPEGGRAAFWLQGRYAILLRDSADARELTLEHCGALAPGPGFAGRAPNFHPYRGAGARHELDVDFRAARFDAAGNKLENARLLRLRIDDTVLHEDVELPAASDGALGPEAPLGPLVVSAETDVAIGDVRYRPEVVAAPPAEEQGWIPLLADETLAGWTITEQGLWKVEDGVIVGEGPRSHLFSPRGDYRDFEVRARIKVSDGGNSGLYLRAQVGPEWPQGYEAQINSSFADPQKTGSLYGLAPVETHLVAPDTWFEYHATCRDEAAGTRVTLRVNGVVVTDFVDAERRHAAGHVALQQHHEGSVVEVKELAVREL